jgi:hypothetical protein
MSASWSLAEVYLVDGDTYFTVGLSNLMIGCADYRNDEGDER